MEIAVEMALVTSPCLREHHILPSFDGEKKNRNIPDFIIENKIVIDFKAKMMITKDDYPQM